MCYDTSDHIALNMTYNVDVRSSWDIWGLGTADALSCLAKQLLSLCDHVLLKHTMLNSVTVTWSNMVKFV